MAPNQDGSGGSPSVKGEAINLSLEQVQALVEGGLLDKLLNKSPAIAAMHDRLAAMETRSGEIASGINQLNEQLKTIAAAAALQAPTAGAETPAGAPAASADDGSMARWAPILNALAVKALGGGEAAQPQNLAGAFAQVLELFKHFTAFQAEVNKANAIAYRTMQQVLRETEPAAPVAHLAAEVPS